MVLESFEINRAELRPDFFEEHPMPDIVKNVYFHAVQNEVISLECLERFNNLERLTIANSKAKEIDLSSLELLPELRNVNMNRLEKLERINLSPLVSMSNLQSLSMGRVSLQTEQVRELTTHATLNFLELSMVTMKDLDLSPLSGSPKLERLILYGNNGTPKTVSLPGDCPALEKIWVNYTGAYSIELKHWESIQVLDLSTNYLETVDFEPLNGSASIERILLTENFIPKLDVSPLFSCENLRSLLCDEGIELHSDIVGVPPQGLLEPTYVKRGKRRRIEKTR